MKAIIRKFKGNDNTMDISSLLMTLYRLAVIVTLVWCYFKYN